MLQKCARRLQLLSSIFFTLFFLSPLFFPCILWTTLAKGYGAPKLGSSCFWAFHCFTMDSKELSSILDCFGDQKAIKTPKLNTNLLELIARVLNMPIELKGQNYYSKVFKRINYRLSNSTFWVVISHHPRYVGPSQSFEFEYPTLHVLPKNNLSAFSPLSASLVELEDSPQQNPQLLYKSI